MNATWFIILLFHGQTRDTRTDREMNERTEAGADRKTPVTEISHKISPHSSNNIMTFPRLGLTAKNPPLQKLVNYRLLFDSGIDGSLFCDRKEVASPGGRKPHSLNLNFLRWNQSWNLENPINDGSIWLAARPHFPPKKNKRKDNVQEAV